MKSLAALLIGVAMLVTAAPVCAQWRGQRPMMRHAPMVFPGGGQRGRPQRPPQGPVGPPPREGPQSFPAWSGEGGGWAPEGPDPGWRAEQQQLRAGVRARQFVPLGQAIEAIRRRTDGRQLDANIEEWNGRTTYRVRWAAPNGRRIDYIVDAHTGEILSADAAP